MRETGFDYVVEDDHATIWSTEKKWINKIINLQQEHPNDVKIIHRPEDNNGMIYAHVPQNWFKLSPPKRVNMTEEQKAAAAERLKAIRQNQKGMI